MTSPGMEIVVCTERHQIKSGEVFFSKYTTTDPQEIGALVRRTSSTPGCGATVLTIMPNQLPRTTHLVPGNLWTRMLHSVRDQPTNHPTAFTK